MSAGEDEGSGRLAVALLFLKVVVLDSYTCKADILFGCPFLLYYG
jgi:hypothetical protein